MGFCLTVWIAAVTLAHLISATWFGLARYRSRKPSGTEFRSQTPSWIACIKAKFHVAAYDSRNTQRAQGPSSDCENPAQTCSYDCYGQQAVWPAVLEWQGLRCSYSSPQGVIAVVHGISGCALPGQLLGLLGPSGAGKSSLLDSLAGRLQGQCSVSGNILLNGKPLHCRSGSPGSCADRICYIPQVDEFLPMMTVGETLQFYMQLAQCRIVPGNKSSSAAAAPPAAPPAAAAAPGVACPVFNATQPVIGTPPACMGINMCSSSSSSSSCCSSSHCEGAACQHQSSCSHYSCSKMQQAVRLDSCSSCKVHEEHWPRPEEDCNRRPTSYLGVLQLLGLQHQSHILVGGVMPGGTLMRGISGGERKRLSLAVGLAASPVIPSVILLDEPTSGLDSACAVGVMSHLSCLAQRGHTLVAAVHQPRPCIWNMLDSVCVLSMGHLVYSGPRTEILSWFTDKLGFPFEPAINGSPADWIMDVVSVFNGQAGVPGPSSKDGMNTAEDIMQAAQPFRDPQQQWHQQQQEQQHGCSTSQAHCACSCMGQDETCTGAVGIGDTSSSSSSSSGGGRGCCPAGSGSTCSTLPYPRDKEPADHFRAPKCSPGCWKGSSNGGCSHAQPVRVLGQQHVVWTVSETTDEVLIKFPSSMSQADESVVFGGSPSAKAALETGAEQLPKGMAGASGYPVEYHVEHHHQVPGGHNAHTSVNLVATGVGEIRLHTSTRVTCVDTAPPQLDSTTLLMAAALWTLAALIRCALAVVGAAAYAWACLNGSLITIGSSCSVVCSQCRLLIYREHLIMLRQPTVWALKILIFTWSAMVVGLTFYQLPDSMQGLWFRFSAFFVSIGVLVSMPYMSLLAYTGDAAQHRKDSAAGLYGSLPYFVAKLVAVMPFNLLCGALYTAVSYGMEGLNADAVVLLAHMALGVLLLMIAAQVMHFAVVATSSPDAAFMITTSWSIINIFFSDFFVVASQLRFKWLSVLHYVSAARYVLRGMMLLELHDRSFSCSLQPLDPDALHASDSLSAWSLMAFNMPAAEALAAGGNASPIPGATSSAADMLSSAAGLQTLTVAAAAAADDEINRGCVIDGDALLQMLGYGGVQLSNVFAVLIGYLMLLCLLTYVSLAVKQRHSTRKVAKKTLTG